MAYKRTLTTARFAQKKRKLRIMKFWFVIFLIVSAFAALFGISRIQAITIRSIQFQGNSVITTAELQSFMDLYLNQKYLGIFPEKNIFLFPKALLMAKIKENWKRIDTINISNSSFHSLLVTITEKKPQYLWCGTGQQDFQSDSDQSCYFTDADGYVFDTAPQFSGNVFLKLYGQLSDLSPNKASTSVISDDPTGKIYMDKNSFHAMADFISRLPSLGGQPVRLLMTSSNQINDADIALQNGTHIFVDWSLDLNQQYDNLQAVVNANHFNLSSPFSTSTRVINQNQNQIQIANVYSTTQSALLQPSPSLALANRSLGWGFPVYIDVRFGNKVYFKTK
jgi:hypothetical protein